MNVLIAARQSLIRRPFTSSGFVIVGISVLTYWAFSANDSADLWNSKPAITRKMHIESIPMCK
jgi:hypothetical protein